jgi:hypothetical protein
LLDCDTLTGAGIPALERSYMKQFTVTFKRGNGNGRFWRVLDAATPEGAVDLILSAFAESTIISVRENNPPLETITAVTA